MKSSWQLWRHTKSGHVKCSELRPVQESWNTISSCKRSHTKALISEREMELRFILSSLKLPFTPRPRLSKRRRRTELCLSPQNSARMYLFERGGRVCFSSFWLREITLSVPVQWGTTGKLLEMSSGFISVPFHKVLLELKSVKLSKVSTLLQHKG